MIDNEDFKEPKTDENYKAKELDEAPELDEIGDFQFNHIQGWEDEFQYYNQEDINANYNPSQNYPMNSGMIQNNAYPPIPSNTQVSINRNENLNRNNSVSSIGKNIDHNLSYSEDGEVIDFLNRTQSVRMFSNPVNSCGLNSVLNNSTESGVIGEDDDFRGTSRSFISNGSRGSNPQFAST